MQPEAAAHVWDALRAAQAIGTFIAGRTEEDFVDDLLLRSATERQLEILGEALNRLRKADPDTAAAVVDLDRIVGMRNVIAHQYADLDYQIIWAAATYRVPALAPTLDRLLGEAGPANAT